VSFVAWTQRETSPERIVRFRIAFAIVWLAYDVADLAFGGTALSLLGPMAIEGVRPRGYVALEVALIVSEVGLLSGIGARFFAAAACALRAVFAWRFSAENDFLYFIVASFLLSAARSDGPPFGKRRDRVRSWPEEALLHQLAWIYVATAVLKLNPAWLSGDTLSVRIRYLASAGSLLAKPLESITAYTPVLSALAIAAVIAELTLAALVFTRRHRTVTLALSIAIHAFAAIATDVWFFGAAMICHAWTLLPPSASRASRVRSSV
jgi:hypothetical protein